MNKDGEFRQFCEARINSEWVFLSKGSRGFWRYGMADFIFTLNMFEAILTKSTTISLIWLLQSCPNGRWILALLRSFAGWGKDASRRRQWTTAALRAKSVSGWLQGPCRVPFSLEWKYIRLASHGESRMYNCICVLFSVTANEGFI